MPLVSYAHCKGKHSDYEPHCGGEEPPPPESCALAPGAFPAFAFARSLFDGRRGTWSGNDIYLADSTGTCELKIFSLDFRATTDIKFRLNGNQGRIVWTQYTQENLGRKDPVTGPVVKLLTFEMNAGEVTNISHTVAWKYGMEGAVGIYGADLSPDGNTVYYSFGNDAAGALYSLDLSACTLDCTSSKIPGTETPELYTGVAMNTSGSRLYFSKANHGLGFMETATGDIRVIADRTDYWDGISIDSISVGRLISGNDAIAFSLYSRDIPSSIEIADVSGCAAVGTGTCLGSDEARIVKSGIPGWYSTFDGADLVYSSEDITYKESVEGTGSAELFINNAGPIDAAE